MKKSSIANASQLTTQLWVGGQLSATSPTLAQQQLTELLNHGIDAIIDTRWEGDDIDWVTTAHPQIDYLHIGVEDAGLRMPDEWFDAGTSYAADRIAKGDVVLSHCQAGINRGPSLGFAILLTQGLDPIEALDLIRTNRPIARVGYAEDAVHWWLRKADAPSDVRIDQIRRVREWRITHHLPRRSDRSAYRHFDKS